MSRTCFISFEIVISTALNRKKNPEKSNLFAHTATMLLFGKLCKAAQFCMVNVSTFKIQKDYIIISRVVCLLQTNI